MNVVNKVIETAMSRTVTKMVPVASVETVIVKTNKREFVLNEKEALLLRDLLGSTDYTEAFKRLSSHGFNIGKWEENDFIHTASGLSCDLSKVFLNNR